MVAVDQGGMIPVQVVNSNVQTFGGFLALYVEYGRRCYGRADQETDLIAQDYDELMREVDPLAFESTDSWWGLVTEQMRGGFL